MIDERAIEEHIRGILIALGDDPDREGIKDTPKRVARMYSEVFEGMNYTNHEIAEMFGKTFEEGFDEEMASDSGRVVVMKDIDMFSYCEHHMARCRRRSEETSRISFLRLPAAKTLRSLWRLATAASQPAASRRRTPRLTQRNCADASGRIRCCSSASNKEIGIWAFSVSQYNAMLRWRNK